MSIDRKVRKISPLIDDEDHQIRPFSDYFNCPNIVLLGAPGAGKTHLFQVGSEAESSRLFTARSFLIYADQSASDHGLYIDALDETRSRIDSSGAVDSIIRRLVEINLTKIRISCRAMDWLGETDLALFKPYFEATGGYVVLQLEGLTREEQVDILRTEGCIDPDQFIREAGYKGISSLLRNPQTLIMLTAVVGEGKWPETKFELFEKATDILLKEHNQDKVKTSKTSSSLDDIRSTAGALCVTQLISDAEGISLLGSSNDCEYPSFDTIPYEHHDVVLVSLGRRVFRYVSNDVASYEHRTIAEFLGAMWVSNQVKNGLPLTRLLSLICVDTVPSIELRGLYAWLPVFLPNDANDLIRHDPLAVLMYGDPKSLTTEKRQFLLLALESHSKQDPWFRHWDGNLEVLGNLAGKDMTQEFRRILNEGTDNFHLRSLILDSIAFGPKMHDLKDDLIKILEDENAEYVEKRGASRALINVVPNGASIVTIIAKAKLFSTPDDIRLYARIIEENYEGFFQPDDVVALVQSYLNAGDKIALGDLWSLPDAIPDADVKEVLDKLSGLRISNIDSARHNDIEVTSFYSRLLLRQLKISSNPTPIKLWSWLKTMNLFEHGLSHIDEAEIREWLGQKPELLENLFTIAWSEDDAKNNWLFWHNFLKTVLNACSLDQFAPLLTRYVVDTSQNDQKRSLAYKMSLNIVFRFSPPDMKLFENLCEYATNDPVLEDIHKKNISCPIDSWEHEEAVRKTQYAAENDTQMRNRLAEFDKSRITIQMGEHPGWLKWVSNIFYARFSDSDKTLSNKDRLSTLLGPERAAMAIEGLIRLVGKPENIPSLQEILNLRNSNKYMESWFSVLSGMHFAWKANSSLDHFSDKVLEGAFAIELFHPVFDHDVGSNSVSRIRHGWLEAIFSDKIELAIKVLKFFAKDDVQRGRNHSEALRVLTSKLPLTNEIELFLINLLIEYPNTQSNLLEMSLTAASKSEVHRKLFADLLLQIVSDISQLEVEQKTIWSAFGFFYLDKEKSKSIFNLISSSDSTEVLWEIRSLTSTFTNPNGDNGLGSFSDYQLEFLIVQFGSKFPPVDYPEDGWNGNTNPWDACEFVRSAINEYSTRVREGSINGLNRLAKIPVLAPYNEFIKHSLANQASLYRQSKYAQPSWIETVNTLSNGQPANASDLLALAVDQFESVRNLIQTENVDPYKYFWNEDSFSRITAPKPEESARDVLVTFLRPKFEQMNVRVEPEGHMVHDKRADIVLLPVYGLKLPVELKRDYHKDVWSACSHQLDRLYARDPEANDHGLYVVFWYGEKRGNPIPTPPNQISIPGNAAEMESILTELIPVDHRHRLRVLVIDVTKNDRVTPPEPCY